MFRREEPFFGLIKCPFGQHFKKDLRGRKGDVDL